MGMIPGMELLGGGGLEMSSNAESGGKIGDSTATQGLDALGGAGNRGFVNNFAAEGASVKAGEINGPAWKPSSWILPGLMIGALGLLAWRMRK